MLFALVFFACVAILVTLAACCCLLLVVLAGALWWSIRREGVSRAEVRPEAFAEALRRASAVRPVAQNNARRREHPRMDLAAGMVAGSGPWRGERRRDDAAILAGMAGRTPERMDYAFSNGKPGDLSDPDTRRAMHVAPHLQTHPPLRS